ncbi:MAG: 30S ribosomal protein S20 [Candidatus Omnitrophica bacterium]|nr:30S ribosomal protein S20 [Candidatus Omnitrophota bacterium]
MPSRKAAVKKLRSDAKKAVYNKRAISKLRSEIKKVEKLIEEKKIDELKSALQHLVSHLDKTSARGNIHRNAAARKVSRLMRRVNKLSVS